MRTVTLISTNSGVSHVIQDVPEGITWGDLLSSATIPSTVLPSGDYEATVRQTHNTLAAPSALLPDGDITIWINPRKVKAGNMRTQSRFGAVPAHSVNVSEQVDRLVRIYQSKVDQALSELRQNVNAVLSGNTATTSINPELEEGRSFFANNP
jgi:hypothetical protein